MKKLGLAAVSAALFAGVLASPAAADQIVYYAPSSGPVPITDFDGTYNKGDTDGDGIEETGTQEGYIAVYDDGVEACNGNVEHTLPDGTDLQGYIWIGANHRADEQAGEDPTGNVGAGHNHGTAEEPTGNSPCPDGAS